MKSSSLRSQWRVVQNLLDHPVARGEKGAISGIFVLLGAAEKKSPPILEKYGPLYQ